uniref:Cytochrome P450 CYP3039A1 n=1 Tax=Tigriopus kingsejongensis TaxID=1133412 RepID=A0A2H4FY80_9MAXI|nr:cytochrome P450 CYP3039A1 [Tigriopus kingsejongensis]
MIFWVILTGLSVYLLYVKGFRKPPNYPPGPPIVPMLGSIPFLRGPTLNDKIWSKDLADQYGPVVGLFFGSHPAVMINDPKVAKEALSGEDLLGRPRDPLAMSVRSENGRFFGLFLADGEIWNHQRRFTLRTMKDLGLGKSVLEEIMIFEAGQLCDIFKSEVDRDVLIDGQFNIPVVNVLWSSIAQVRFENDNPKILEFMAILRGLFRGGGFLKQFFAILKHFPNLSGLNNRRATNLKLRAIIQEEIENHKDMVQTGASPDDFIGKYLREMETDPYLNEKELLHICQDLFGAGTETVSSTLIFSLAYLVMHPEVQQKCFEEIIRLQDIGGEINLREQQKFVYVNATINEVFRKSSMTASIIPHRALRPTKIMGYDIPYDTMILTNMMLNNNDPDYFQDPEDFRPERFIDDHGKLVKNDILTPFGVGKRICPGEALARGELFVFLAYLIRTFAFSNPLEQPRPNAEVTWGMARLPLPFYVRLTLRK